MVHKEYFGELARLLISLSASLKAGYLKLCFINKYGGLIGFEPTKSQFDFGSDPDLGVPPSNNY